MVSNKRYLSKFYESVPPTLSARLPNMVSVQQNMDMNDELAALFYRNLTFNPELQAPPAPVQQEQAPEPKPIVYSISQHYTHSAHIVKAQKSEEREEPQRHSSEPPQSESLNADTVLRDHGVDPNTLTPSQIQLFRIADAPQQLRLLELWSICPPGNSGDIPSLAWSSTTLEQEEQLAQLRYERAQQEQQQQQQQQTMTIDTAAYQTGDGRWVESDNDSEPYMLSGYEEMMRRERQRELEGRLHDVHSHFTPPSTYTPATDPVYMGADYIRQQQMLDMATQYGAFQQFRGGACEIDAMDVM